MGVGPTAPGGLGSDRARPPAALALKTLRERAELYNALNHILLTWF
jgi:hypothetical protein